MLTALSSCSTKHETIQEKVARAQRAAMLAAPKVHTATLEVAAGAQIAARTILPEGFVPVPLIAPIWLQQGQQIVIVGTRANRTTVLALDSATLKNVRVIASDFGPDTPGGTIAGIAASPDGTNLALAMAEPASGQLGIWLRPLDAQNRSHQIASFPGQFGSISLDWIDSHTIALGMRSVSPPPAAISPLAMTQPSANANPQVSGNGGLFLIDTNGPGATSQIKIDCPLTHLRWSPNGRFAIGAGDPHTPPVLIDRAKNSCTVLRSKDPISVIAWAPHSDSFLYSTAGLHEALGTFRYDLIAGTSALIAVSSAAAAYTSDGEILALGNQDLSWRHLAESPNAPVSTELAMFEPQAPEIRIVPLGIRTLPPLLAVSRMVYALSSDSAAIDLITPGGAGPLRELITYLVAPRTAFLMASGPAHGEALLSWSPDGKELALIDGDGRSSMLTVFSPAAELQALPRSPGPSQPPGAPNPAPRRRPRPAPTHDTP